MTQNEKTWLGVAVETPHGYVIQVAAHQPLRWATGSEVEAGLMSIAQYETAHLAHLMAGDFRQTRQNAELYEIAVAEAENLAAWAEMHAED